GLRWPSHCSQRLTTSGSNGNSAQLLILPGLRSMQMRQPLRAAISASNFIVLGHCPYSLGEMAKRAIGKPHLFEVPHCILEIFAAGTATAGGSENQPCRLVERQLAGIVCATGQRSECKSLPRVTGSQYPQQPRAIDHTATHLPLPYTIER